MRNRQLLTVLLFTTMVAPYVVAASVPFPPHVQAAIILALESEDLVLGGAEDAQFVRYDALGKLESFQCPSLTSITFNAFGSGMGGGITVGECPKNAQLNENMAKEQGKGFDVAVLAVGGNIDVARKELGDMVKSQVIKDHGTVFIHLGQWFISGVGGAEGHGAGMAETTLMIPPDSKTVILIQGGLHDNACSPPLRLPICNDFRGAMREVARQVHAAQARPVPPPAFKLEPLRPGRPTFCDSRAWTVAGALEQSDAKQIPVTETIRYKQHAGQSDIQGDMRAAAYEHAKGFDITTAATNVGKECYHKSFEKQ
jgi:hypothetical protein